MPPFLRLLAFVGILIGSMSALFALAVAAPLLVDRDEYVKRVKEELPALVSPSPSPARARFARKRKPARLWDTGAAWRCRSRPGTR